MFPQYRLPYFSWTKVEATCARCGAPYMVAKQALAKSNYCSNPCKHAARRKALSVAQTLADGTTVLPLYSRDTIVAAYARIDERDAAWASQWRWSLGPSGYGRRSVRHGAKQERIYLHRALLGLVPGDGFEADHIDRDRLNCTRANLRAIPKAANRQNRPAAPGARSPYRGVDWSTGKRKWRARVTDAATGRPLHVGYFATEEAAAEAARAARRRWQPYAVD